MLHEQDLTFLPYLTRPHMSLWIGAPAGTDSEQHAVTSWLWSPEEVLVIEGTPDHIDQLTAAGWERVGRWPLEGNNDVTVVQLWWQLADIRFVQMPGQDDTDTDGDVWARSADLARVRTQPVMLAFTVPEERRAAASAPTPDGRRAEEGTISLRTAVAAQCARRQGVVDRLRGLAVLAAGRARSRQSHRRLSAGAVAPGTAHTTTHRAYAQQRAVMVPPEIAHAFDVLYLQVGAPPRVVRAVYRALAPLCHPDAGGDETRMKRLNLAHERALAWAEKHQMATAGVA